MEVTQIFVEDHPRADMMEAYNFETDLKCIHSRRRNITLNDIEDRFALVCS